MKIIVDINHPAHVHFFKNFIKEMELKGNDIIVTASKKDVSFDLLEKYSIKYINVGSYGKSILMKLIKLIILDIKIFFISLRYNPDIYIGVASFRTAHSAWLLRKKSFVFDDTEHSSFEIKLYKPFATKIFTPDCFFLNLGRKHEKYPGYHELAYLHPNRFNPNSSVLNELGITESEIFFIIRFVSWQASHDIGQKGLSFENQKVLVDKLSQYGRVIISSEKELPDCFEKYRMPICATKMHDLIYYAAMYIGEGGTMASEAAVLGTFSIYINSLPAMGYIKEEIERYNLIFKSVDFNEIMNFINKADFLEIVISSKDKRQQLISDKIDTTEFIIKQIENL